jgi:hypothetical protein
VHGGSKPQQARPVGIELFCARDGAIFRNNFKLICPVQPRLQK